MRYIRIEDMEIISGFCDTKPINMTTEQTHIHQQIITGELSIDDFGNMVAETETGGKFWIKTSPDCYKIGKTYSIRTVYNVYSDPKCKDFIYKFSV